jgi:putative spermidine/putrescine transport system ATP-binding protein
MLDASTARVTGAQRGHAVSVERISHRFGNTTALRDVTLEIAPGELVALLGPSGCGKTTLLRAIAGFVNPDQGDVRFDGESVTRLSAGQRGVGIMFQNYALFPHMTAEENIAYGLEARKLAPAAIRQKVNELIRLVHLDEWRRRYPRQLSGGQQQRVALARALAIEPRVLLLDEPFAALDKNLRLDMQIEIRRLQQSFGVTAMLVTHDQEEAMSMADRIAVMEHGQVHQFGRPIEVYDQPTTLFVNQFLGAANLIAGRIARRSGDANVIEVVGAGEIALAAKPGQPIDGDVVLSVRPENLRIVAESGASELRGAVRMILPLGAVSIYEIVLNDGQTVKVTELRNMGKPMLSTGAVVALELVSAEAATLFGRRAH